MQITPVHDGDRLAEVYVDLLAPAFPPDELDLLTTIEAGVAAGTTEVLVLDDGGTPLAVAVADVFAQGRVVLLSYLAAHPAHRASGHGGRLLAAALDRWTTRHDPCMVLAEIEDPDRHPASGPFGDPVARLRFYARRGARVLDVPYFQPSLRPGGARVSGLLLIVLHAAQELRRGDDGVDAATVSAFLRELFLGCEGDLPDDDDGAALLQLAAASVRIRTTPLATGGPQ